MSMRAELIKLTSKALINANVAGGKVFTPETTPTQEEEMPIVIVRSPRSSSDSQGRSAPEFLTVTTITVAAQVTAGSEASCYSELLKLFAQIRQAIVNDYNITKNIQQFLHMQDKIEVSTEGEAPIGMISIDFDMEYLEVESDFAPIVETPLEGMDITADMGGPYDPNGKYPNPQYPKSVVPAPRTSGPDGRAEAGLIIDLPQN